MVESFTKRCDVNSMLWHEVHENMESAIEREAIERIEEKMEIGID